MFLRETFARLWRKIIRWRWCKIVRRGRPLRPPQFNLLVNVEGHGSGFPGAKADPSSWGIGRGHELADGVKYGFELESMATPCSVKA